MKKNLRVALWGSVVSLTFIGVCPAVAEEVTFIFTDSGVLGTSPLSKELGYEGEYSEARISSIFPDLEVYDRENCDGYGTDCIIVTDYNSILEVYPDAEGGILHIYGGVGATDEKKTKIGESLIDAIGSSTGLLASTRNANS
jgi:hypothetical protein